jgi:hypothetical protein
MKLKINEHFDSKKTIRIKLLLISLPFIIVVIICAIGSAIVVPVTFFLDEIKLFVKDFVRLWNLRN